MKIVPITRLRRQKRIVGENQLNMEDHMLLIAPFMAGDWRERREEREKCWRESERDWERETKFKKRNLS